MRSLFKPSILITAVLVLFSAAAAWMSPVAFSSLVGLNADEPIVESSPTAIALPGDPNSDVVLPGPPVPLNQALSDLPKPAPTPFGAATTRPTRTPGGIVSPTPTLGTKETLVIKPPAKYYWGVWIDQVPFDMSKLTHFEATTKRAVDIIHWGEPWMTGGVYQKFQTEQLDQVREHGSIPLLDWGSWDSQYGFNQPNFHLRDIYEGKHDAYIREWANAAKAWRYPFFLRFDHEMNGWWSPWSEQLNDNQPGDFVKAWRHVHDIFTELGVNNVTWVWSPNVIGYWRLTPEYEIYPGSEYVDWVAMDGFNWGTDLGSYWQTFSQVFRHTYDVFGLMAPGKPIMIAEVASSENGGPMGRPASKAAWIKDAFGQQLPANFPNIKAVVWYNSIGSDGTFTWPIDSSPASLNAFLEANAAPLP